AQFAGLPGLATVGVDGRVLTAALALTLVTGVIFGTVPALAATDDRMGTALSEEARGSSGSARARRLRSGLLVGEIALSLVLLAGAALLIVSFTNLVSVAPGFQPAQLFVTRMTLPGVRYPESSKSAAFFDAVYERLRAVPGIQRVAGTTSLPFDGVDSRLELNIEHRTEQSPLPVRAHPRLVSTEFFQTMGIPLIRGRVFTERDTDSATNVAIINETAARRYWPNEDPVGKRISLGEATDWREIVGIVADIRHEGLDADAEPAAFLPQRQTVTSLGSGCPRW